MTVDGEVICGRHLVLGPAYVIGTMDVCQVQLDQVKLHMAYD